MKRLEIALYIIVVILCGFMLYKWVMPHKYEPVLIYKSCGKTIGQEVSPLGRGMIITVVREKPCAVA